MKPCILTVSALVAVSVLSLPGFAHAQSKSRRSSSSSRSSRSSYGDTYVSGYIKKDGTYVQGHYRSKPNGNFYDNYSTKPNYNPYTGETGRKVTPPIRYSPSPPSSRSTFTRTSDYSYVLPPSRVSPPSTRGSIFDDAPESLLTPSVPVRQAEVEEWYLPTMPPHLASKPVAFREAVREVNSALGVVISETPGVLWSTPFATDPDTTVEGRLETGTRFYAAYQYGHFYGVIMKDRSVLWIHDKQVEVELKKRVFRF